MKVENSKIQPVWRRWLNQRGSAMVMVLGTIAVCTVMLAHVASVSTTISRETLQYTGRDAQRFRAESAAETAYWMHLNDRRLFSNRQLGQADDDEFRASADFPSWMLDGRAHEFDDGSCFVYMQSAENGFDVNNPTKLKECYNVDDTESQEIVDDFIDVLNDYIDNDDFVKLNGLEQAGYADLGMETLPRNGKMQYAAEIYWLPGWRDAIPGEIKILPPPGIKYQNKTAKPSFFSATLQDLASQLDVESDELDTLLAARERWMSSGESLEDILEIDLLSKVKAKYSFDEAKVGIFYAAAYDNGFSSRVEYRVIRENNLSSKTAFADSQKQTLCIWERSCR